MPLNKLKRVLYFFVVLSATTPASAQDTALTGSDSRDKSSYTLFNPTPDDQMRSFSPDRPTKLNSSTTVDAGHFQYEADIVNWTYDRTNSAKITTSNFVIADPTLKVGLTNTTDFELAISPLNVNSSDDRTAHSQNTVSGYGDMYARVKYNLFGNDGGDYALAVVPFVKLPTASHLLGNQHWEGGGYAPFTIALPDNWSLTLQTEIDILENNALDGMHPNEQNAISIAHPIFYDNLTAAVDFWSLVDGDKDAPNQYTIDVALALTVGDNMQLDGGINVGVNKAAPDLQPYIGISQRF